MDFSQVSVSPLEAGVVVFLVVMAMLSPFFRVFAQARQSRAKAHGWKSIVAAMAFYGLAALLGWWWYAHR